MIEDVIEFLKTWDWFLITLLIGSFVFVGSLVFVMLRLKKHNPSFLRLEKIMKSESERDTTYDWNRIRDIFGNCVLFGGGFYMISNVIVFVILGEWYTNPIFLAAITAIFGWYLLQSFDKFYRKMMKN